LADSTRLFRGDIPQVRTDVDFRFSERGFHPADATEIPPWLPHFYFDPQKLRRTFDWRGKP
jgi:hypothetical protein